MSYEPTGFSETIFKQRYAITPEESWNEACSRLARQNVLAESPLKARQYEEKFFEILIDNLFVPGGRIWTNSGRNRPNMLNCFVIPTQDSKEGWGNLAREMIITSMAHGGIGIDFSEIRPNGSEISNGGNCPGPLGLMELINGCGNPVKAGGSRRVALMFSLDLDHPDVDSFLDAKLKQGHLQLANVSVRSKNTSDFIKAVKKDLDWELIWKTKHKSIIKAKDLWNKIVKNAYESAEPGFLNWELVLSESTTEYISGGSPITTNPCGEIAMPAYDACCLGHLVLHRFVENDNINWSKLADTIRLAVRFLDNTLTVNHYPLVEMKETCNRLRRIGLGVTGLADMLAILGYRYGSEDSIKFIEKLFRFISKQAYEASIMLSIEKGAFPECLPEKHLESGFVSRMPHKIKSLLRDHGIRNCAILTVAPTGTVSILSGNCSSGIEPMFAPAYERRYWEGDKRQVELIQHPLFRQFMLEGKDVSHFVSSRELSVRDHMNVQKVVQKHIDNAVSKTINIPEDYPIEEVSELWLEYLPYLKGTTFYRENTRGYINAKGEREEPPLRALSLEEAKERFKEGQEGSEVDCTSGVCEI